MIPKTENPLWVTKEFADDFGLEYDILIKPRYIVHINDPNGGAVMDRYYKEEKRREWNSLSLWDKIKRICQ